MVKPMVVEGSCARRTTRYQKPRCKRTAIILDCFKNGCPWLALRVITEESGNDQQSKIGEIN